jgi:hypothetical protein
MLTINCDLHPLLARFDRRLNDKGEPAEKRTPVLLAEEDFDEWLDASPGRAPIYFGTFGKDDLDADPAPSATRRTTQLTPLDTTDLRLLRSARAHALVDLPCSSSAASSGAR